VSAPVNAAAVAAIGYAVGEAAGGWAMVYEISKKTYEQTLHPNRDKEHDY
jgi:phosphate/sulfate permease